MGIGVGEEVREAAAGVLLPIGGACEPLSGALVAGLSGGLFSECLHSFLVTCGDRRPADQQGLRCCNRLDIARRLWSEGRAARVIAAAPMSWESWEVQRSLSVIIRGCVCVSNFLCGQSGVLNFSLFRTHPCFYRGGYFRFRSESCCPMYDVHNILRKGTFSYAYHPRRFVLRASTCLRFFIFSPVEGAVLLPQCQEPRNPQSIVPFIAPEFGPSIRC